MIIERYNASLTQAQNETAELIRKATIKVSYLMNHSDFDDVPQNAKEKAMFDLMTENDFPQVMAYTIIRAARELYPKVSRSMNQGDNPKLAWELAFQDVGL